MPHEGRWAVGGGARKFAVFILVLVAIGAGTVISAVMRAAPDKGPLTEYAQARIVMYSLTTCGYCNIKRAELKSQGIPFVEHFIDKDPARKQELFAKLAAAGYKGRGVGTPTFEVNGRMLPNNPSLATIRKHL
jgi:glutaredoxin